MEQQGVPSDAFRSLNQGASDESAFSGGAAIAPPSDVMHIIAARAAFFIKSTSEAALAPIVILHRSGSEAARPECFNRYLAPLRVMRSTGLKYSAMLRTLRLLIPLAIWSNRESTNIKCELARSR